MAELAEQEKKPSPQYADNLACECPCGHVAPIKVRTGFMVCSIGKEKLCEECVQMNTSSAFDCHYGHD